VGDYHNKWIGVDLDGTLAEHTGYKGEDHVGKPIAPMVKRVRDWLAAGYEVRIFTARRPHPAIRKFCREQFGRILPITSTKDAGMLALWDDRAIGVRRNAGEPFSEANVKQVKL
jgi:hypothetical protein